MTNSQKPVMAASSEDSYKKHKSEKASFICPFGKPGSNCKKIGDLHKHKKQCNKKMRINCFLCDFQTKSLKKWARHLSSTHADKAKSIANVLRLSSSLRKARTFVAVEDSACSDSRQKGNIFQSSSKYIKQSDIHNGDEEIRDSAESKQGIKAGNFKSVKKFNKHESLAAAGCSTKCDKCDVVLPNRKSFRKHLHCSYCDLVVSKPCLLKEHERIHTCEKPYACPYCEYRATRKHTLTIHLRTHSRERLYPCDLCDYVARGRIHLKEHKRTHTGDKPYSCSICKKKFTQGSSLNRHVKREVCRKLELPLT